MLWLALYFPRLALDVIDDDASNPSERPLAIIDSNNRILACCERAEALGIEAGTTLATAHSICPELRHAPRDEPAEQRRLQHLASTLYRFSSLISIQTPDCILIEIAASLRLFGAHDVLAEDARSLCQRLGSVATTGVARTPWASIALARSGRRHVAEIPLSQAGLHLAGVKSSVIERLHNMGIHTLEPLLKLEPSRLGKRFGRPLLEYLGRLTGTLPDPREGIMPAPEFNETRHFLEPATSKEALYLGPMQKLGQALQEWLISHELGVERIEWRCHGQTDSARFELRFAAPKQQADAMLALSELKLGETELPEEVLGLSLEARGLSRWAYSNHGLFPVTHGAHTVAVEAPPAQFIDEINARLGDGVCRRLQPHDQHTPEHAWANVSATAHSPGREASSALAPCTQHAVKRRPLWLLEAPQPIRRGELTLLEGPERIQSNWWQRTAARDYYVARARAGSECWVFKDLCGAASSERWYLHGYFG